MWSPRMFSSMYVFLMVWGAGANYCNFSTGGVLLDTGIEWFMSNNDTSKFEKFGAYDYDEYLTPALSKTNRQASKFTIPRFTKWIIDEVVVATGEDAGSGAAFVITNWNASSDPDSDSAPVEILSTDDNFIGNTNLPGFGFPGAGGIRRAQLSGLNVSGGEYWLTYLNDGTSPPFGSYNLWYWANETYVSGEQLIQQYCGDEFNGAAAESCRPASPQTNVWVAKNESGNQLYQICGTEVIDDACNDAHSNATSCNADSSCNWCGSDNLCLSECSLNRWCSNPLDCQGPDLCEGPTNATACEALSQNCGFCEATGTCLVSCTSNPACSDQSSCSNAQLSSSTSMDQDSSGSAMSSWVF